MIIPYPVDYRGQEILIKQTLPLIDGKKPPYWIQTAEQK